MGSARSYCSVCLELQRDTPSGATCSNGHGGADGITAAERKQHARQQLLRSDSRTLAQLERAAIKGEPLAMTQFVLVFAEYRKAANALIHSRLDYAAHSIFKRAIKALEEGKLP